MSKPRKVQRRTLHAFVMREAADCGRMKPKPAVVYHVSKRRLLPAQPPMPPLLREMVKA